MSSESTIAPPPRVGDVEKASEAPVKPAGPTFPEGGLMGWAAVAGSWMARKSSAVMSDDRYS